MKESFPFLAVQEETPGVKAQTHLPAWKWGLVWSLVSGAGCALISGCSFAPKCQRPAVQTAAAFKELTPQSLDATNIWKAAQLSDAVMRGKWWEMFANAQLNALEERVVVSNQNVAAAFANFLSARALVKEARAQLFPTLAASPSVSRSRQPFLQNLTGSSAGAPTVTEYALPLDATWQLDLWGRIRNTVKANAFQAQASRQCSLSRSCLVCSDVWDHGHHVWSCGSVVAPNGLAAAS
jgi:outer membrane protein TolC